MSGENCSSKVSIIGGTYRETCYWPTWNVVFGSGWRAVRVFRTLCPDAIISYYSAGDEEIQKMVKIYAGSEPLEPHITPSSSSVSFYYDYPLSQPVIQGVKGDIFSIVANGTYVIGFGMMEATAQIEGEWVVYDPQSPSHPLSYRGQGGKAEHLALIMNEAESRLLTGESDLKRIRESLFRKEQCESLVIKRGAKGAVVFQSKDDEGMTIPAFKTPHVWPIGSGDVFTTVFAYFWFNGMPPEESALKASQAAATYCDTTAYEDISRILNEDGAYAPIAPQKQGMVYLAGPFFTLSEKLFVAECRTLLAAMGVKVFSPYHDIGEGKAEDVVPKDIDALKCCDCVFAIVDGLDSGTLFEIGYAVAHGKRVVAYVENETEGALKMLAGTGCDIEKDFTTAIYKTCWYATE